MMKTIEEIQAEMLQYKKYEDVPKELRTEYNKILLQTIQQEEDERYKREHITRDIPLDRLEEVCNAERDGRLRIDKPLTTEEFVEIAKTIGLTPEEAEQALKGGAE